MNTVHDIRTLSQRFLVCATNDQGILPDQPAMFEALAGALVADLMAREAVKVEGDTIVAKEMVGNTDMPVTAAYDLIKLQPMKLGEFAEAINESHPDRYNAIITELLSPLVDAQVVETAADVNGLNAYISIPAAREERVKQMMGVVLRSIPSNPVDQGLAILLDYVGLLDELTNGKDQEHEFAHRLHKEEGIDAAEGRANKGADITNDLLAQMVGVGGEMDVIL